MLIEEITKFNKFDKLNESLDLAIAEMSGSFGAKDPAELQKDVSQFLERMAGSDFVKRGGSYTVKINRDENIVRITDSRSGQSKDIPVKEGNPVIDTFKKIRNWLGGKPVQIG